MPQMSDAEKLDYLIEENRKLRHYVTEEIGHMRIMFNALELRMNEFARYDFQLRCRVDEVSERLSELEETFQTGTVPVSVFNGLMPFEYECPGPTMPEFALVEALLDLNVNHNLSYAYNQIYSHIGRIVEKGNDVTKEYIENLFRTPYKAYYESNLMTGVVEKPAGSGVHDVAIYEALNGVNCVASGNLARSYLELMHVIFGSLYRYLVQGDMDIKEFLERIADKAKTYKEATDSNSELRKRAELTFRLKGQLK